MYSSASDYAGEKGMLASYNTDRLIPEYVFKCLTCFLCQINNEVRFLVVHIVRMQVQYLF